VGSSFAARTISVTHAHAGGPAQQEASALIRAAVADYTRDQNRMSARVKIAAMDDDAARIRAEVSRRLPGFLNRLDAAHISCTLAHTRPEWLISRCREAPGGRVRGGRVH
jgi:hypothetical protein